MKAKFVNVAFSLFSLSVLSVFSNESTAHPYTMAHAELASKSDSHVSGSVDFKDTKKGLEVKYSVQGLSPSQPHGFHVHQNGDCTSADAKSAGGHYVEIAPHGGTSLDTPQKFAGDLQQIAADQNGRASGSFYAPHVTVGGKNSIIGRAIMIHGGPDDPAKKSAPRIGCGVIEGKKHE